MTASELIAELHKLPPDTRVLVDGYEGGYDEILIAQNRPVVACPDHASYEGAFDEPMAGKDPEFYATILHRHDS